MAQLFPVLANVFGNSSALAGLLAVAGMAFSEDKEKYLLSTSSVLVKKALDGKKDSLPATVNVNLTVTFKPALTAVMKRNRPGQPSTEVDIYTLMVQTVEEAEKEAKQGDPEEEEVLQGGGGAAGAE